jgi:diguanylate cyclase (GGDEF)-like protein/PAS domain S-box-containing protein
MRWGVHYLKYKTSLWHAAGLRFHRWSFSLLGLAMIGLVWAGIGYLEKVEQGGAELAAMRTADNIARAFERHFYDGLNEVDRLLTAMRKSYTEHPKDFHFQLWAPSEHSLDDRILLLSIAGPDGIIKLTNLTSNSASRIDLSELDHFKVHVHAKSDDLYISKPVIGRTTGKPSLLVTRRIENMNGSFGGIIGASISSEYFRHLYETVDLGSDGFINVTGTDGIVRITDKPNSNRVGLDLSKSDLLGHFRSNPSGHFYTEGGASDKIPRLVTYRAIGNYPLILSIGLSKAEIFGAVWAHARIYNYTAVLASILILTVVGFSARRKAALVHMSDQISIKNLRFSAAIENMSQGLCMFDATQRLIVCNKRYAELYGLSEEQAKPGTTLREILEYRVSSGTAPDDHEKYISDRIAEVTTNNPYQITNRLRDGRYVSVVHKPMGDGGWVATHDDITAQKRDEQELDETKKFLNSIIENIPVAVVVKNAMTRKFVLTNRAFEAMLDLPQRDLLGQTVFDIYRAKDAELIDKSDREFLRENVAVSSNEYEVETPMRGLRTHVTNRIVIRDAQGDAKYLVVVIDDVTDRKQSERQISFMAHHDALTGLANRAAVAQKIEEAAARQRRRGEPFSILLLDLDRFKQVNDTLGHPAGDALLQEVASRLNALLRETDVLARLGGDEFVIIQTGENNQRQPASALADRLIKIIAEPFNISDNEVTIGASIGIALAPEHATNPDDLLKMADMALYRAKSSGRNGYCFFDLEMSEAATSRHEIESELRQAIQNDEFELHYQPIVEVKTRKICGAEALVRWRHPTKGMIAPDRFIPLAEETGLITQIGEWVLRAACIEAVTWPADIKVSVNLSPVQFRKSNLVDVVMYALAQSGLPPERLELEITETALIESAAECLPTLRQFKSLGITIALDDFGTGYSSLGQLTMFQFDKIKIDKSFTQNMTKRTECAAIIAGTLTIAQSLGIATTAEGVETVDQYRLLRLAGVTSLQGYLFKRPGPACEIDFDNVCDEPKIENAA